MANDIKRFCEMDSGANLLTQAEYIADAERTTGNQPGKARSKLVNKALRQAAYTAAALTDLAASVTGDNISDSDAGTAALVATLRKLFGSARNAGDLVITTGAVAAAGTVLANGALLSRAAYPRLYVFAAASGNMATSDGAWTAGQYSPGDGSATFRVPNLGGYFVRALDSGAGIDTGRAIGSVQADAFASHVHQSGSPFTVQSGADAWSGQPGAGTTGATGGSETRPKNIAYLMCIAV